QGHLAGLYNRLSLSEATRHPAFRWRNAFAATERGQPATHSDYCGEDIAQFEAVTPDISGRGKGFRLVFDQPTPALIAQYLDFVRKHRPANCRGVILFRYPQNDPAESVPLPSLLAVLRNEPLHPEIRVRLSATHDTGELIENPHAGQRAPVAL